MADSKPKIKKQKRNAVVLKSRELQGLWQADYTLGEFKLLDAYLARIDARDPSAKVVRFTKTELEEMFGVTKLDANALERRAKYLSQPVFVKGGGRMAGITLFEKFVFDKNQNGEWVFEIQCTEAAKKYFFNIEKVGYFKYQFARIANLTSIYSYILFQYLMQNSFRKSWTEDLEKLKQILRISEGNGTNRNAYYDDFRHFNQKILKPAQEELRVKSGLTVTYKTILQHRKVVAIHFAVEEVIELPQSFAGDLLESILQDSKNARQLEEQNASQLIEDSETENENTSSDITVQDDSDQETEAETQLALAREAKEQIAPGFGDELFDELSELDLRYLLQAAWVITPEKYYKDSIELVGAQTAHEAGTVMFLKEQIILAKRNNPEDLFSYLRKSLENLKAGKTAAGDKTQRTAKKDDSHHPSNSSDEIDFFEAALRRSYGGDIPPVPGQKKD